MTSFNFTLSPEAVQRLSDALVCLAKFDSVVGIEASAVGLKLSALNSSKTAAAVFTFHQDAFFQSYRYGPRQQRLFFGHTNPPDVEHAEAFTCEVLNKALSSVFKGRGSTVEVGKNSEKTAERCEVSLVDEPGKTECRLVVKMITGRGVKKIYRLNYAATEVALPAFDRSKAKCRWRINAHVLKTFSEYFGPRTENLDMFYDGEKMTFTSYTEKVMHRNEVLKQPLHTSIAIDKLQFEAFRVEEQQHVGIAVKDFRSIVVHADTLKAPVSAHYSVPTRPLQLCYRGHGILSEFTMSTSLQYRGGSMTTAPASRLSAAPGRPQTVTGRPQTVAKEPELTRPSANARPQPLERSARLQLPSIDHPRAQKLTEEALPQSLPSRVGTLQSLEAMPPPPPPASRSFVSDADDHSASRFQLPTTSTGVQREQPLFLTDDDEPWDEHNYDEDDQLGWEDTQDPSSLRTGRAGFSQHTGHPSREVSFKESEAQEFPPTQHLSGIRGIFD